jgi:hypothetical protein
MTTLVDDGIPYTARDFGLASDVALAGRATRRWVHHGVVRRAARGPLRTFTPQGLTHVAHLMDTRPRKTLGWETPAQRLADLHL